MQQEAQQIKGIAQSTCPHCDKTIFVELQHSAPSIGAVLTNEQILQAKQAVVDKLRVSGKTEVQLAEVMKTILDETFLLGPDDVESVVEQFM